MGVINSIGKRKDAKALELLQGLTGNADKPVASAAAHAIGRIGTVEAAAVLTDAIAKDSPVKRCLGDGALACAEGLAAAGKKAEAVALYETVAKAAVPKYMQIAALDGQFRLQKTEAKDLLLAQIRSEDKANFKLGLSVARWMPGADVTAALAGELEKLPAGTAGAAAAGAGRPPRSGPAAHGRGGHQERVARGPRSGDRRAGQAGRRFRRQRSCWTPPWAKARRRRRPRRA